MISNILSQQGLRSNQPRLYSGPYKDGPSATGIFANLREQIFQPTNRFTQGALFVQCKRSCTVLDGIKDRNVGTRSKVDQRGKKILEEQLAKLSPSNQESKGQGGKNGSDPNTESKKQQDVDEGAGSELAKFNTKLNNDMSMSIPAIPSVNAIKNMGSSQPWTKLLGDSITPHNEKAEVWNWLGKTVVIDRGIGRAPPASHTKGCASCVQRKRTRSG